MSDDFAVFVASSSLIWTGDADAGHSCLQRALSMCSPESVSSRIVSFLELQTMADSDFPYGRRYYTKSGYFAYLDDGTIDRLLEAVGTIPSSETQIELAYLGGAAAEIGAHLGTGTVRARSPFLVSEIRLPTSLRPPVVVFGLPATDRLS